jgi:hypothetical protein
MTVAHEILRQSTVIPIELNAIWIETLVVRCWKQQSELAQSYLQKNDTKLGSPNAKRMIYDKL